MSASGGFPPSPAAQQALISAAQHDMIDKYYALASIGHFFPSLILRVLTKCYNASVMLVYDTILTFDREVETIWTSKWTTVKFLFFFNRQALYVAHSFTILFILSWTTHSYANIGASVISWVGTYGPGHGRQALTATSSPHQGSNSGEFNVVDRREFPSLHEVDAFS